MLHKHLHRMGTTLRPPKKLHYVVAAPQIMCTLFIKHILFKKKANKRTQNKLQKNSVHPQVGEGENEKKN